MRQELKGSWCGWSAGHKRSEGGGRELVQTFLEGGKGGGGGGAYRGGGGGGNGLNATKEEVAQAAFGEEVCEGLGDNTTPILSAIDNLGGKGGGGGELLYEPFSSNLMMEEGEVGEVSGEKDLAL
ncbi:hypothetical protein HAX54_031017 [Datura stramonium]|uniref:Uncharacterized protein n=1 Tax=Datura stramonium TaxID=4076 RepID=A0ABS8RMM9_DATST|nr:hypothetical protein [Datura stramonium]